VQASVIKAWKEVGITVVIPEPAAVPYSVVNNKDGRVELFSIGADKALYHNRQLNAGSDSWSGWKSLGGSIRQFTVTQNQDGRLQVFCVGAKNSTFQYITQQTAGSDSWSDWKSLGESSQSDGGKNQENQLEDAYASSEDVLSHSMRQSSETWSNQN
ncbi:MAG TPA: hypothetical protein VF540_03855, partial [Segetibacter sp.]